MRGRRGWGEVEESTQVCTLLKVKKASDWKAAAWNLEGENVHSVLSAPGPADDVTKDWRGT